MTADFDETWHRQSVALAWEENVRKELIKKSNNLPTTIRKKA